MPSKIAFTTTYFFCHFLHLSHKGLHSEKEMSVICAATSQGFPVYHSGSIPPPSPLFVKGGGLDFLTQRNPGGTKIFQNQGGKEEFLKFSFGGKLLEMKLQTENKISE